ncbi:MAG: FAD:protein FMN transferase, partial [Proteobacteria bacterium]|nr:FAD:protein FMN transferase [Pseudomonadota bacterium]
MPTQQSHSFPFFAMGCPCEIQVQGQEEPCRKAAERAIAEVKRLERAYSRYRSGSITSLINFAGSAGTSVQVDQETAELIDIAFRAYALSDGLFDITSGAFREIWNDRTEALPSTWSLAQILDRIGLNHVTWENPTLAFKRPGMQIDLGGIVKEYAADRAAEICRLFGGLHGLVDLGGDIAIIGPNADGSPIRIGVRDPEGSGAAIAMLQAKGGGIATSGSYERFWMIEGKRLSHIIDPRTGWPVEGLASVTIAAPTCLE